MMLLIKFAGPMYGIVGYLTGIYAWDFIIINSIRYSSTEIFLSNQRVISSELLFHRVRQFVAFPPAHNTTEIAAVRDSITALDTQVSSKRYSVAHVVSLLLGRSY